MRVSPDSFEQRYLTSKDPWGFATSAYELAKYDATVQALARPTYRRCFEPGCSIGVLTERLAQRCDVVVACDASPSAVAAAAERLSELSNVELAVGSLPDSQPHGPFDLVVVSEIAYYWDRPGLEAMLHSLITQFDERTELLAVHWLGAASEHLLDAEAVHDTIASVVGPSQWRERRGAALDPLGAGYLLERWELER